MKLTLRVEGSPKLGVLEGTGPTLRLGRDPECEISLGDKFDSVSWRHAKIALSAKGVVLTDLESTNGTFVNDKRLQGAIPIKKGDHIRLGHGGPTLEVVAFDLTPSADPPRKAALPETEPYTPSPGGVRVNKQVLGILIGAGGLALLVILGTVGFFALRGTGTPASTELTEGGTQPDPTNPRPTPPHSKPGNGKPAEAKTIATEPVLGILKQHCGKCHGPDVAKPKGDFGHILDLDKMIASKQIVRGNAKESELFRRLTLPEDDTEMMPPPKEKNPLTPAAITQIKQWIDNLGRDVVETPPPPPNSLAAKAQDVLKTYCYECHGLTFKAGKLDVTKHDILLNAPVRKGNYVTPRDLGKSYLWRRMGVEKDMPPAENKQPSPAELATVEAWIKADAAPFPPSDTFTRKPISEKDVLAAILNDLQKSGVRSQDWPNQRYFSLVHLHNNKEVSNESLALYRAGLSKLVNSLSRKARIVLPKEIDDTKAILRIDTSHLDWDQLNLWQEVIQVYPYALRHDRDPDPDLQRLADDVYRSTKTKFPVIRADWFIANASVPPLYHTLLQIPMNAKDLERQEDVNVIKNFMNDKLKRAGFRKSGVSNQNRLVERHESRFGFYWKSYDFKERTARSDLAQLPLGPNFPGNPFSGVAFDHDGGEIIYSLPNGLQAYMLVNGKDERINEGPPDVVFDPNTFAGDTRIKNGLSCMGCHRDGMRKDFEDIIRKGHGVVGTGVLKIQALYVEKKEMQELVDADERRFLAALKECTEPYLQGVNISLEPITALAKPYLKKDLNLADVALELGETDTGRLKVVIETNQRLRSLGLGPLADGYEIKREKWEELTDLRSETLTGCFSAFQQVALELRKGEPTSVQRMER